jgi:hypothetical protein
MAAHSVSILKEMLREAEANKFAVGYAGGLDELDFEDWQELESAYIDLIKFLQPLLDKQTKKWEELKQPNNHEEWMNNKFPSGAVS